MSDLEDLMKEVDPLTTDPSMPKTAKAIRDAINRVNRAISSSPDPILSIVGLDNKQKELIDAITAAAKTGQIGDGKIFVFPIEQAVRIRTGERDNDAL